ncbi:MAG: histidine kinase dimerization/phospho-acceptor domain-containing protein, partial [Salibacteraceae bacterium]
MSLLNAYYQFIRKNCLQNDKSPINSVDYWQNRLFSGTMEVVIPLSLITTIPGIIYALVNDLFMVVLFDVLGIIMLMVIAFSRALSLNTRKHLLIATAYLTGFYLMLYVGLKGPGLLFLLIACIFAILILPVKFAYRWSWINTFICFAFAGLVYFDLCPVDEVNQTAVDEWAAISVNLIFISFLSSALIPKLYKGIDITFEKQQQLQEEILEEQRKLKKTNVELEAKSDEIQEFVYFVSHDLQEPLRMVNNFMGQLERKYSNQLDEKAIEYIHFATDGGNRMRKMIEDLLEFSRLENSDIHFHEVDLNQTVSKVLHSLKDQTDRNSASIEITKLPTINSSSQILESIFQNLISNSIKYRKDDVDPVVKVYAEENEHSVEISVEDNGIGIGEEY